MNTRRRNRYWLNLSFSLILLGGLNPLPGAEFDFQRLLSELSSDSRSGTVRAEEKIRNTLEGREDEIWGFVKFALLGSDSGLDSMQVQEGLRALQILGGFDDRILDDYLDILRSEAAGVTTLTNLIESQSRGPIPTDDLITLGKKLTLIGGGIEIFEEAGSPLPREVVLPFVGIKDEYLGPEVIAWFQANGDERDVTVLAEWSNALRSRGDIISADQVENAINQIGERSGLEEVVEKKLNRADLTKVKLGAQEPKDLKSPASSTPSKIPWILGAIALIIVVIVLLRAVKSKSGPS